MAKTPTPAVDNNLSQLYEIGQCIPLGKAWYTVVGRATPGGSGDVYFLKDPKGNNVAVKIFRCIDPSSLNEKVEVAEEISDKLRRLFKRERDTLKKMSRRYPDCFPRYFGGGEIEGNLYYLMERLEPIGMDDMLRLVDDEQRKKYILDVCEDLAALHSNGLVHYDIKPINILKRTVDGKIRYVLGDFGSVHRAEKHDAVENLRSINRLKDGRYMMARTLGFKDPMDNKYTIHADIYALGQVIRNMFADDVPMLWSRIILKCISNNFDYRYESVQEIADAIKGLDEAKRKVYNQGRENHLAKQRTKQSESSLYERIELDWKQVLLKRDCEGDELLILDFDQEDHPEWKKKNVVFKTPLRLKGKKALRIIGPVVLDADIFGPKGTLVILTHDTVLHNHTSEVGAENGVSYMIGGSAYLNFVNLSPTDFPEVAGGVRRIFRSLTAGAYLAYGGPRTWGEIRDAYIRDAENSCLPKLYKMMLRDFYEGRNLSLKPHGFTAGRI